MKFLFYYIINYFVVSATLAYLTTSIYWSLTNLSNTQYRARLIKKLLTRIFRKGTTDFAKIFQVNVSNMYLFKIWGWEPFSNWVWSLHVKKSNYPKLAPFYLFNDCVNIDHSRAFGIEGLLLI